MIKDILLDMDGVCTDFVGSVLRAFELSTEEQARLYKNWPHGEYHVNRLIGVSRNAMWKKIDSKGVEFWSEMPEYPWFDKFYADLSEIAPVTFCTSPGRSHMAASGKIQWLQKKFGSGFDKYVLTPHKHLLSKQDSALIDDSNENIDGFNNGPSCFGLGLLFPRPWNNATREEAPEEACDRICRILI
jgi:hypothetical protein